MTTMKAVTVARFGGPEALEIHDIQRPLPGADEVLIRVRAASVNPVDYKIRAGHYPPVGPDNLPKVLGRDLSGVVEAAGTDVTELCAGDRVFAMLGPGSGSYSQFVAVKSELCVPMPAALDYTQAAAVPLAGITAWQGLFDEGRLEPGQRVLIHGGAGGVGHLAIQFAKSCGAHVSTTVSGKDREFVRSLGADQAIDYRHERFEDLVSSVDLVLDLIAGETQERSWTVLKDGGTLVSTLAKPSQSQAQEHHARATNYVAHPDATELRAIANLINAGKVRPVVTSIYPLEEVGPAQQELEAGHPRGKVVLEVHAD